MRHVPPPTHPLPWLQGFDPRLVRLLVEAPFGHFLASINDYAARQGQCTGLGHATRFVAQACVVAAADYESQIAYTGEIPTRDNLHDRYNALVWLTFPKTKAALNRYQVAEIRKEGGHGPRGYTRDALTVWDENLAVLVVPVGAGQEVRRWFADHDWEKIFLAHRARWGSLWKVYPFGHALLEKLAAPFKAITAHLCVLEESVDACHREPAAIDAVLARCLAEGIAGPTGLTTSVFYHLPVMGIPGWHCGNADPVFYDDATVFRPSRRTA
ncbi:MAG: hypothetical protein RLZZ344_265 [Pseudomonadota bacterium]|jgi:hypothetical protein